MPQDKYSAVWVSHSSIGDFLKCPRAYFLHNVYKNPETGRKIGTVSPALSLGQAVHHTLEALKLIPAPERLEQDLRANFEKNWEGVTGKKGGFISAEEEIEIKKRGYVMIDRVIKNPGPLANKTIRLKESENNMPSNFYLSEDDNIILCGLIDWLEYVEIDNSIRIIDFKTGKYEEGEDSLQLPIYLLLLDALQKRRVSSAAYWYLEKDDAPVEQTLPNIIEARKKVLKIAREIKRARENKEYECPRGASGCFACQPYEAIIRGESECIGTSENGRQDLFIT